MKKSTILLMSCLFLFINNSNSQTWIYYTEADGLAMDGVAAVAIDAQGNKWFGTIGKGVSKFDGKTWTTYNTANGQLTNDIVSDIAIDKQGHIVIGTASGFSEFDGITWKTYTTEKDGMPCDNIHSIAIDTLNNKWFAAECEGSGVVKFDGIKWSNYSTVEGLPWIEVWSIGIDSQGNKWYSCNFCDGDMFLEPYIPNYLLKFDGITWTKYTTNELLCNWITALAIDAQGNKWIGTDGGGVIKFDGTKWTNYTNVDGSINNNVRAITVDAIGNIWFGTISGLFKFNGTSWIPYSSPNGWEPNYIYDIAIDAQGNKWLGTFAGVSKLSDVTTDIISKNENHLNLYPNPVENVLHINLPVKTGTVLILNMYGECIMQKQITENESTVDVSCLKGGIYFVRVFYDNQFSVSKIVKY